MHQLIQARMYVSAINATARTNSNTAEEDVQFWTVTHFNAVYSPDPTTENYSFSTATPSASCKVRRLGESKFKVGVTYRLLFTRKPADAEPHDDDLICYKADSGDYRGQDSLQIELGTWKQRWTAEFSDPVHSVWHGSRSGTDSNNQMMAAEWTEITMMVNNKAAWDFFEAGAAYRVAFMPVTLTEA